MTLVEDIETVMKELGYWRLKTTVADLRARQIFPRAIGVLVIVEGYAARGDGGGGIYYWDNASSAADDGFHVVTPSTNPTTGRWVRVPGTGPAAGVYDARWFGVKGDGTNETAKLQAAADYVGTLANGGVLRLPAGVYDVRNLALPSKITLRGDGIGKTTLRPAAGGPGVVRDGTTLLAVVGAVAADSVRVEGITVDLATNQISANGIALLPGTNFTGTVCTDCDVVDCEVLGADFHEYLIWTMRGQRIRIEGNRCEGNFTDFARTFTTTHGTDTLNIVGHGRATGYGPVTVRTLGIIPTGLQADFPYYWISTGADTGKLATSEANALAGVAVAFSDDGTGTHYFMTRAQQEGIEVFGGLDVTVRGNQVRRIGRAGINLGAAVDQPNTFCTGLVVEGNVVQGCRVGISLGPAWDAVNGAQNLTDIIIAGNDIRDSYDQGIIVATTTPNTTITNILVEGNTVVCLASSPFSLGLEFKGLDGESHKNVAYRGNQIAGAASVPLGAIALRFANDLVVEDNMVIDSQRGVYVTGTDNLRLEGNVFDGITKETILADDCGDLSILDNQFIRYGLGALNHCLQLTSVVKAWIRGNRFAATANAALHQINAGGDQIVITGNRPPIGAAPFNNAGTNPNIGNSVLGAGQTTLHVPNTLMSAAARLDIVQTAGAPQAFRAVRDTNPSEGFRITVPSAAVGDETFRWEIHL